MEGSNNDHPHLHDNQLFNSALGEETGSEVFDDDGRIRRTGTVWTASAHIITAVMGSGVLPLAWAMAQLGWVAGPVVMLIFSFVTYYSSSLLAECYRTGDSVNGSRNYSYMDAVRANLGGRQVTICGLIQYLNLFGVAIGYTIAASISMKAIWRLNCFHEVRGEENPCDVISTKPYMIFFGVAQTILSQIPGFDLKSWLSMVGVAMSCIYSTIGLGLAIAKVAENGKLGGSLTGVSIGAVTASDKIWRTFRAMGEIAFAYPFSMILLEIQDTVKSPPSESATMKRASLISVTVTALVYLLYGCIGYAAFGDSAPENLLTGFGFGFYNPFWVLEIANVAIVVYLIVAYQAYCQPLFAFVEKSAAQRFPNCGFITNEIKVQILSYKLKLNLFRLVSRTISVITTTTLSMLLPFEDIAGLLVALGFWPLTVYYPVEMCINQRRIPKWSTKWWALQILSVACLVITIAASGGYVAGLILDLKGYKPFAFFY